MLKVIRSLYVEIPDRLKVLKVPLPKQVSVKHIPNRWHLYYSLFFILTYDLSTSAKSGTGVIILGTKKVLRGRKQRGEVGVTAIEIILVEKGDHDGFLNDQRLIEGLWVLFHY